MWAFQAYGVDDSATIFISMAMMFGRCRYRFVVLSMFRMFRKLVVLLSTCMFRIFIACRCSRRCSHLGDLLLLQGGSDFLFVVSALSTFPPLSSRFALRSFHFVHVVGRTKLYGDGYLRESLNESINQSSIICPSKFKLSWRSMKIQSTGNHLTAISSGFKC